MFFALPVLYYKVQDTQYTEADLIEAKSNTKGEELN